MKVIKTKTTRRLKKKTAKRREVKIPVSVAMDSDTRQTLVDLSERITGIANVSWAVSFLAAQVARKEGRRK